MAGRPQQPTMILKMKEHLNGRFLVNSNKWRREPMYYSIGATLFGYACACMNYLMI